MMWHIGAIKCLFFVSVVWGTPETTDFDVYHPMRTDSYLVKTTLPGGGNFANKLQPGYIYVWNGVKPRCPLQKMMNSMIYKEPKFLKNLGKEKDPKPDLNKLGGEYKENLNIDDTDAQKAVRTMIIKRLKNGNDLCDFFTENDKKMEPVDESARVHLQKRIDAKTLMGPEKHVKNLRGRRISLASVFPWFMKLKSEDRTVHPEMAKAYGFRRYVDRDCDHLLDLMPSYVDCIDGRKTETVMNGKGKMNKGVKYTGDAPISKDWQDLHKMTRLKKERVSMVTETENNHSIYHDDYYLKQRADANNHDMFLSILDHRKLFDNTLKYKAREYKTINDALRMFGKKTPLLSPMFMRNIVHWRKRENHMSDQLLAVRDWAPRNIKIATGELNPYWRGKPVNKYLYPVINFNGRPMWRDNANQGKYLPPRVATVGIAFKPLASLNWRDEMQSTYEELRHNEPVAGAKAANFVFIPKMNGSPDWGERTSDGKKFVYTYSAGCWTKLAPENYGYDIPTPKTKDSHQYEGLDDVPKSLVKKYKKEHTARKKQGKEPKYKINKAMNRWWKGEYGKQHYFSLKDAITQKRCNGDEMLWYLFYSKPSKMDEFCTNTNFGNRIPKDFCKNNPPVYFNFTVTAKNIREPHNRGKTFSYRPDWHKTKFGNDFVFTGFASENNPNVWDTQSVRDEKFENWFNENYPTGRTVESSSNVNSLSFMLLITTIILPNM